MRHVPNLLTLFRIICSILIAFRVLSNSGGHTINHSYVLTLVIFGVVTDLIDGPIARYFGVESELGKKLDPIADKMFGIACGAYLISTDIVDGVVVIAFAVIATAELIMVVSRAATKGMSVAPVHAFGKTRTVFLSAVLLSFTTFAVFRHEWIWWCGVCALLPTIVFECLCAWKYANDP